MTQPGKLNTKRCGNLISKRCPMTNLVTVAQYELKYLLCRANLLWPRLSCAHWVKRAHMFSQPHSRKTFWIYVIHFYIKKKNIALVNFEWAITHYMMALKTKVDLHVCRDSHKTKDLEETELSSKHTDSLFQHAEAVLSSCFLHSVSGLHATNVPVRPSVRSCSVFLNVSTRKALTQTN